MNDAKWPLLSLILLFPALAAAAGCGDPADPGPGLDAFGVQVWSTHDDSLIVDLRIARRGSPEPAVVRIDGVLADGEFSSRVERWSYTGRARPDPADPVVELAVGEGDETLVVRVPVHARSGPAAYTAEGHLALPVRLDTVAWTQRVANEVILYDAAGLSVFASVVSGWQDPVLVAGSAIPPEAVRAQVGFPGDLTRVGARSSVDVHIWALVFFDLP